MWKKMSIGFRLNSMICTLLILSCLAIICINAFISRNALEREIRDATMPSMVQEIAAKVQLRLSAPASTLLTIGHNPTFLEWIAKHEDPEQLPNIIQSGRYFMELYGFDGFNIVLRNSRNFYEISPNTFRIKQIDPAIDSWFDYFERSGDQVFVNVHGGSDPAYANRAYINTRIEDAQGNFLGVLASSLSVADFVSHISQVKIGDKGLTLVARKNGTILLHPDINLYGTRLANLPGFADLAAETLTQKEATFASQNTSGERLLVAGHAMPLLDAMVFTVADMQELLAPFDTAWKYSAAAGLVVLLLGFFLSSQLVQSISLNLNKIIRFTDDVATGNAPQALDIHETSVEMRTLSMALNEMYQNLRRSNVSLEALHGILNGVDAMLYVTDPETNEILFINNKMQQHCDIDPSTSVTGKICWETLQIGMNSACPSCPVARLRQGSETSIEWEEHYTAIGRYYRNTDTLIDWADGKKAHLQHSVDITSRKLAEEDVQKRLEQQALMASISQSFISSSAKGELVTNALRMMGSFNNASHAFLAPYNSAAGNLRFEYEWHNQKQCAPSIHGTVVPLEPRHTVYNAFVKNRQPYIALENIIEHKDFANPANAGVMSFIAVPIIVSGEFWGILGMDDCQRPRSWSGNDIHLIRIIGTMVSGVISRTITEEELTRMSLLVTSAPQYIAYINEAGDFQYLNPGASLLLGHSEEEIKAGGLPLIFDEWAINQAKETLIPKILAEGKANFELPAKCKDGTERILAFSAFTTSFRDYGIGAIALDVTENRTLEKQLTAAKRQAEQSSRAKSDFLSRMSHEMRTPLNAIIGMTSIARTSSELQKKEYCLERIESASTHLLGVINDILDMSKIEANKVELSFSEFVFEKMLMRILNVVNFTIEEKEQTLHLFIDRNVPFSIISDEQRLGQVIANLLSNAVKFTPQKGSISLSVRALNREKDQYTLEVEVRDSGIGVSKENQAKLFKSFEQADGGIARKFGGTGLGLAISKRIVELLGGQIRVESEPGQGASFIFTIAAQCGNITPMQSLGSGTSWQNVHALVVTGDAETRSCFLGITESTGISCDILENAQDALAALEQRSEEDAYAVIWIDRQLPGMDGIALAREIRKRCVEKTALIMLSGENGANIQEEALAAGIDTCLVKPLFSSMIIDSIVERLNSAADAANPDSKESAPDVSFAGHRVLLAEDVLINQEILLTVLEDTGLAIDCANNGKEAFAMYEANPGLYNLIFMDIHMPEVDGYEATRRIRALGVPGADTVPIIAMTANVFREDIERCMAAGMNDHLGKPIDRADIIAKLKSYLPPLA